MTEFRGEIDIKFPFWVLAAPRNSNFIIFPETSIQCLDINKKYGSNCNNWDQVSKICKSKIVPFNKKLNNVYFKGTNTTKNNSNIREYLNINAPKNIIVNIDAWNNYETPCSWSKYKFLLNLPGNYTWSNRLKYLFLLKSLVINVETYIVGDSFKDEPYISFIDLLIDKNDYIPIEHVYYRDALDKEQKIRKKIKKSLLKFAR